MTVNDAKFELWLEEALATDIQPSDDFTSRVMERVAATPQEPLRTNGADKRKLRRMLTTMAACAAIVILIPFGMLMMPKGAEKAAADCAMPEMAVDDAAADMEMEYATNDAARLEDGGEAVEEPADDTEQQYTQYTDDTIGTPAEGADAKEKDDTLTETAVYLEGSEAKTALAALSELGIVADIDGEEMKIYSLSAEETAQLRELLPYIIDVEGVVELTLEVAQ